MKKVVYDTNKECEEYRTLLAQSLKVLTLLEDTGRKNLFAIKLKEKIQDVLLKYDKVGK